MSFQSHDTTCQCQSVYQKYKLSILYVCEDIYDEKCRQKEKERIQRGINRRRQALNPPIQVIVNSYINYKTFYHEQLPRNLLRAITVLNAWRERKINKYRNEQHKKILLIWIIVGQGPTALAVGAGGGCLDIFSLVYKFSFLSPSPRDSPI